jgi:hypothetical protein
MIHIYWSYGDVLYWHLEGTRSVILSRLQVVMKEVRWFLSFRLNVSVQRDVTLNFIFSQVYRMWLEQSVV